MSKITLFVFCLFVLFSCKTTQQAIDHNKQANAPDAFEEGIVEEIEDDPKEPSKTKPSEKEKKKPMPFRKKIKEGINFIAMGTEPDWSLEFKNDSSIIFTSSKTDTISFPFVIPSEEYDRALLYESATNKTVIKIVVKDSLCVNQLSGKKFNQHVQIALEKGSQKDFKSYTGCGQYLGDFHLTGEWDFITFNGDSIERTAEMPKTPFLTFSLKEGTIAGYAGCNTMKGSFDFGYKSIKFGPFLSTRMFCPNMEFENKITNALSDQIFSYTVTDNNLILKNKETIIVFKKH